MLTFAKQKKEKKRETHGTFIPYHTIFMINEITERDSEESKCQSICNKWYYQRYIF